MTYLIKDTEEYTLGEINDYFQKELMLTTLKKEDIEIEDSLKIKIGMMELQRIFDENGMADFYEIDLSVIHLKRTGNTIEFSNNEILSRFEDAYDCILNGCKGITLTLGR
jgi:hypothetical protein